MSVVGFVFHYVHFLDPFTQAPPSKPECAKHNDSEVAGDEGLDSKIRISPPTPSPLEPGATPILLLGGYSYGAMVTSQLPSLETIAALFHAPQCGTHAAEVRLRAQHLAETQNTVLASAREAAVDHLRPQSPRKHVGLRVGGDEECRKSHESRRSLSVEFEETIRHGVAELMARSRKGHRRSHSGKGAASREPDEVKVAEDVADHLPPIPGWITFRPTYLLISPLQGIVTNLATMSLPPTLSSFSGKMWTRFSGRAKEAPQSEPPEPAVVGRAVPAEAEDKLVQNSTLAIYGDRDGFVPVKKLREWASRLEAIPGSKFRAHEVSSANHFWAQSKTSSTLREAVAAFAASLLLDDKTG
jgi:alpha/beta superfamily hydrolase